MSMENIDGGPESKFLRGDPSTPKIERNPTFNKLLDEMKNIHDKKSRDYALENNVYSNFEFAAMYAGVTVQQAFDVLIGVKQARLLNLISSGKDPLNESVLDTMQDKAIYNALQTSYAIDKSKEEKQSGYPIVAPDPND